MTTKEIADRLVALNRANDHLTAYRELYAPNVVSIENWGPTPDRYEGMEAIAKKGETWMATVAEMHSMSCSEPLVADNSFAVTFTMDITYKEMGRINATEMAIYKVADGKIVSEEFIG
jgi:SnoaL-like domain